MYKILLVDGHSLFDLLLLQFLGHDQFLIEQTTEAAQAQELMRHQPFDVVVVDWSLPNASPLDLCKHARGVCSDAAIFIINAESDGSEHEKAIACGADDYLKRPANARQLAAKIRAVLRRKKKESLTQRLVCGSLSMEFTNGSVIADGQSLRLRPMEYVLLEFFMRNQNRVFNTEQLWRDVWKRRGAPSDTVKAHVNMLRRKLQSANCGLLIHTVKGRGYKFEREHPTAG